MYKFGKRYNNKQNNKYNNKYDKYDKYDKYNSTRTHNTSTLPALRPSLRKPGGTKYYSGHNRSIKCCGPLGTCRSQDHMKHSSDMAWRNGVVWPLHIF